MPLASLTVILPTHKLPLAQGIEAIIVGPQDRFRIIDELNAGADFSTFKALRPDGQLMTLGIKQSNGSVKALVVPNET